jgi:hypothetical protein
VNSLLEREDFVAFLAEEGLTMVDIEAAKAAEKFSLKPSPIEGLGAFANHNFADNEIIDVMLFNGTFTTLGRYMNHSPFPNTRPVAVSNGSVFQAATAIRAGEELTVDYRSVRELLKKFTLRPS